MEIGKKITNGAVDYARSTNLDKRKAVGFGMSAAKVTQDAADDVIKIMNNVVKKQNWYVKIANWFATKGGDLENIFITAFGTAIVAPLFIYYNPIAKEDKDTRKYSAWRQPVSAVIATTIQAGLNIRANNIINNLAEEGKYKDPECDLRELRKIKLELLKKAGIDPEKLSIRELRKALKKKINSEELETMIKNSKFEKMIKANQRYVKGRRDVTSIVLSLITLPFACYALNWAYPRFMDLAFPELSKAKKLKQEQGKVG